MFVYVTAVCDVYVSDLQMLLRASLSCSLHVGLGSNNPIPEGHPYLSAVTLTIVHTITMQNGFFSVLVFAGSELY